MIAGACSLIWAPISMGAIALALALYAYAGARQARADAERAQELARRRRTTQL